MDTADSINRKCEHGVYWPQDQPVALYCQLCNPAGNETATAVPIFNRRGSLKLTVTGKLPKCPKCGIPIAVSNGGQCTRCGDHFEIQAQEHLKANNRQPGVCPVCASGIHYEIQNGKRWECADCGEQYDAQRRIR